MKLSSLIIEESNEDITSEYNGGDKYILTCQTIDNFYWGRNGVSINCNKIKQLTLGGINTFAGIDSDTICVLNIKEEKDTLVFPVKQGFDYARMKYVYSMPLYNKQIDSIYCNRIIRVVNIYDNRRYYPFEGTKSSFKLEIGRNLMTINDYMFSSCKIPYIFIPNNIQKIGKNAFSNCNSSILVTIEDGETPLDFGEGDKDYSSFYGCPIDSIYIGRNIVYSQYSPFYKNTSVSKLVFGNNVTEICDAQFYGCSKVAQLSLSNKLQRIGKQAFYGCEGLTTLTIPCSVTEIGKQAFDLCRGLKTLSFEDGDEELNFVADLNQLNNAFVNSPVKELYLGRNIYYTNISPFMGMETLSDITVGEQVSSLGQALFGGCTKVSKVVSNIQNPFSLYDGSDDLHVFADNIYNTATLYVPKGTKAKYMTTDGWKKFFNIIEASIDEFIFGDVNRDNKVTITDAVCIVNYILGMPSAYLNIEVADINGDGKVSISDAVSVVNIILNNGGASAPAIEAPDADKSAE